MQWMYFFMRRLDLFFILKLSSVILSVLFYFIVWISCTFTQIQKQIIRAIRRLLLWLFCSVHCVLCSMKKVPFVMECNNSCIMYRMFAIKWKKKIHKRRPRRIYASNQLTFLPLQQYNFAPKTYLSPARSPKTFFS